jgi:hypothetical protein
MYEQMRSLFGSDLKIKPRGVTIIGHSPLTINKEPMKGITNLSAMSDK